MTEWVDNHIRIEGPEGALASCVEHCFPGRKGLACDHVLPIPEVIRGVTSGRTDAVGSDGAIGVEILTGQPWSEFRYPEAKSVLESTAAKKLKLKTPADLERWARRKRPKALEVGAKLLAARDATRCWTEKDWKVTHWSTRSASVSFVVTADNATFFEASIETAYAPAMGVYYAMVAQYPKLKFRFRAHPFGDDGIYELNGIDGTFTETHIPFTSESLAEFGISWEEWQDQFTQPTDTNLERSYSKAKSTRTARSQRFPLRNWWRRLTRRQDYP